MPGMTLCGEALTFAHDQTLLGFCLDNPDEPEGDDFDTRCKIKLKGRWFDSRDPKGEVSLQSDDDLEGEEDHDVVSFDDEPRSCYAQFCAMSVRDQAIYIADAKAHICALIGVSFHYWEPSNNFVLDAIQDETPDAVLKEMAYADYLATHVPPEDNPSDEDFDRYGLDEENDLIRIGQKSVERGMPNIGYSFSNCSRWLADRERRQGPRARRARRGEIAKQLSGSSRSRRSNTYNSESHCPKYGRQDFRHHAPRIEAKYERLLALEERKWAAWEKEAEEKAQCEAEMEEWDYCFRPYEWEYEHHLSPSEMEWKMEEMAIAFGYMDNPYGVRVLSRYRSDAWWNEQRMAAYRSLGDREDIFEDYSPTPEELAAEVARQNAKIDAAKIGHSSCSRLPNRYRQVGC